MNYLTGIVIAVIEGICAGWFFYMASVGPRKNRIAVAVVSGIVIGFLGFVAMMGK